MNNARNTEIDISQKKIIRRCTKETRGINGHRQMESCSASVVIRLKMPSRPYRLFGILLCHTPEHEDITILQETVDP